MGRITFAMLFVGLTLISRTALAHETGDHVIVLRETPVKRGNKATQTLRPGRALKVYETRQGWLWVSAETTGWIAARDVATPKAAIQFFSDAIRRNPNAADAYIARGNAKHRDDAFDDAIADYNAALRLNPTKTDALTSRAMTRADKGLDDKALADLDAALRIDPDSARALYARGVVLGRMNRFEKAAADFSACLRLSPGHSAAYQNRAHARALMRDFQPAIEDANRATSKTRSNGKRRPWV
jgi:tetratricopeptide (TPR) repeat protein